jgi:CubicO group peptidase (beta-lactamase class C family)
MSYDEKVSTYWPEFAQNGKHKVTVADVCRHSAGLFKLPVELEYEWTLTDNIKQNKIGKIIEESQYIKLPDELKGQYHHFTCDLITNEIFRRVEP